MAQKDQRDLLFKLLHLIMSSKSKEEQQREALQCLSSNPDFIVWMFKFCSERVDNRASSATGYSEMKAIGRQPVKQTGVHTATDLQTVLNDGQNSTAMQAQYMSKGKSSGTCIETNSRKRSSCESLEGKSTTESEPVEGEEHTKRRKSKYYHIQGDLSHIEREPKCAKVKLINRESKKKRKRKQKCNESSAMHEKIDGNVVLVRKLMEMLLHPKSRQHQECALALLKSDQKLMEIFMEEKAKLGKKAIPVFARKDIYVESKANTSQETNPADHDIVLQHADESQEDNATSQFELDQQSSESFISYLYSLFKSNQLVFGQDWGTRSNGEAEETVMNTPEGNPMCDEDGNFKNQNAVRHQLAFDRTKSPNAHPSAAQRAPFSSPPVASEPYFDSMVYEHFQELSRDLFTSNNHYNVEPDTITDLDAYKT